MRRTPSTSKVVGALAREPAGWRHGYWVMQQTGLRSGTLYPILQRLADEGLLEARWETPASVGRPVRHLYRLTTSGRAWARAAASAQLGTSPRLSVAG